MTNPEKNYRKLQILIWGLQQPRWPLTETSRQEALNLLAEFINFWPLDPQKPRFLPQLAAKIKLAIRNKEEETLPEIPQPLLTLAEKCAAAFFTQQEEDFKLLFSQPDKNTQDQYLKLVEKIKQTLNF